MTENSSSDILARLRDLAKQAEALERVTGEALAESDAHDDDDERFRTWRAKTEQDYAAKLAAALAERDLTFDKVFRDLGYNQLVALEDAKRAATTLRAALEASERERESLATQVAGLTAACAERLAALEALHTEYAAVAAEAERRAQIIASLQGARTQVSDDR